MTTMGFQVSLSRDRAGGGASMAAGQGGGRGPFSALASPKVDSARTDDGVGSDGIHAPGGLLMGGARALDAAGQARSGDGMAGCSEDGGSLLAVRT